jgi:hypothetical protein
MRQINNTASVKQQNFDVSAINVKKYLIIKEFWLTYYAELHHPRPISVLTSYFQLFPAISSLSNFCHENRFTLSLAVQNRAAIKKNAPSSDKIK